MKTNSLSSTVNVKTRQRTREQERDTERYVECEKGCEIDLKEGCCFGSHIEVAITL